MGGVTEPMDWCLGGYFVFIPVLVCLPDDSQVARVPTLGVQVEGGCRSLLSGASCMATPIVISASFLDLHRIKRFTPIPSLTGNK